MRVLIDTSAWVEYLNGRSSVEAALVTRLIESTHEICTCGVIVAEVFQGLRGDRSVRALRRLFTELFFLEANGVETYFRAADVYRALRRRGVTVRSTIDCLIAVLAEENGCVLLARDRDLVAIAGSGLVGTALLESPEPPTTR